MVSVNVHYENGQVQCFALLVSKESWSWSGVRTQPRAGVLSKGGRLVTLVCIRGSSLLRVCLNQPLCAPSHCLHWVSSCHCETQQIIPAVLLFLLHLGIPAFLGVRAL